MGSFVHSTAALVFLAVSTAGADLPPSRAGGVQAAEDYQKAFTAVLQEAVDAEGWVQYDLLRGKLSSNFRAVLKAIEDFDTATLDSDERKLAFWMNAYNVQMLANLVNHADVDNIIEDGMADAFFRTPFRTAGLAITLDEIENVIIRGGASERPELNALQVSRLEPRIHVGLNCGALSCPRLLRRAFDTANLDRLLETGMRLFVNSRRHFRVTDDRLIVSSLIDWYGEDFDRPTGKAGDFLLSYLGDDHPHQDTFRAMLAGKSASEIRSIPSVEFEYLWSTNDAANR